MNKTPIIVTIIAFCFTAGISAQNPSYTIRKGDTLYSISKKYNIKIESLKNFNGIDDPSKLYPGMEIRIPGGYTVKKGDTLYSIAKEYNTTVSELLDLNSMDADAMLKQGQFLHVPADALVAEEDNGGSPVQEEEQAADTIDTEVVTEQTAVPGIWPHDGARTAMTGKLQGIQISGAPGDAVVSVAGGLVVWASSYGIYKKLILVEGSNGLVYGYGGNELAKVKVGDYIAAGSVIGVLGGRAGNSNAFFFVYKDGKPLDPAKAPRV